MKYLIKESEVADSSAFQLGVSWRKIDGNQAANPYIEGSTDYFAFLAGFWNGNQTMRYEKKSVDKNNRMG